MSISGSLTAAACISYPSLPDPKFATDRCGRLQFELPDDATAEEVAYIESLVPRIDHGLLELREPGTGEVVFSCRPSLTGESLLKTATSSGVKLKH